MENKLWYKQPARVWEEALPIGNGRMGAMVFGGVDIERLQINEDTLWSGYEKDTTNPNMAKQIPKVRKLVFEGKYKQAEDIIESAMLGPWSQSYLPLGNLYIKSLKSNKLTNYKRELDIEKAVISVEYGLGGSGSVNPADIRASNTPLFRREYFVSAVHGVIVMRITSNLPKSISISAFLDSEIISNSAALADGRLTVSGSAPSHVEPSYVQPYHKGFKGPVIYDDSKNTIKFCAMAKAVHVGGTLSVNSNKVEIIEADEVLFIIAAHTDFKTDGNIELKCKGDIDNALKVGYEGLLQAHVSDYQSYYNRVTLDLGGENNDLPTDARLNNVKNGNLDVGLEELLFNYGRYLLISSSRPGSQPANLQGIWNHEVRPPWSCNLTLNINAQMNYWPAETCNLAECHLPFLQAVGEMCESGKITAQKNYNMKGFAVNHNCDIWRLTTAVGGKAKASYWPMGGAWAVRHLFEHYEFNNDIGFLRDTAFPIMKEAALFIIDWLVEDNEGHLVT
ncbi:MAG: glycoside hydrolase family 95 protein, partial [Firmicutes bacterium]|nr:glycoside hydrolase family 95 protein [Bacillota bacterium]